MPAFLPMLAAATNLVYQRKATNCWFSLIQMHLNSSEIELRVQRKKMNVNERRSLAKKKSLFL